MNQKYIPAGVYTVCIIVGLLGVFVLSEGTKHYVQTKQALIQTTFLTPTEILNKPIGTTSLAFSVNDTSFTPSVITVKKDYLVNIALHVTEGAHNLDIQAFGINSPLLPTNKEENIHFVATQSGTFVFTSNSNKYAMPAPKGEVIVTPL